MTPLTPQITAKASGDKKRTSVYLRKPGPLRKLQHTHTHTEAGVCDRGTAFTHTLTNTSCLYCISTST